MLTSMIFSLLAVVFLVLFMLYKRRFFAGMLPGAQPQLTELQQQLEQTADEVVARLENKIAHLEYLLESAEEKIARLEKLTQASADGKISQAEEPHHGPVVPPKFEPVVLPPELPDILQKNIQDKDTPDNEQSPESTGDDKQGLVLAMTEQGYSVTEIAKATGKGKGEIMLILQLHKK